MGTVDRGGAAKMSCALDALPDVVESLSVAEQNERAPDQAAVASRSEPAVDADAAQAPPCDQLGSTHHSVAEELADGGRRKERLARWAPECGSLDPDAGRGDAEWDSNRRHKPAKAFGHSHGGIVRGPDGRSLDSRHALTEV
jgi:hypothetical protein